MENDEILVLKCQQGDKEAFGALVEAYQDRIYALALRMTFNREESLDIAQSTFLKAYKNLASYKPSSKFYVWIYTIALNIIRNHLRRRKIIQFFSLSAPNQDQTDIAEMEIPDPKSVEDGFIAAETREKLEKTVNLMPESVREAFVLYYIHELSVKDIAASSSVSENAVKLKLFRARNVICKKFGAT